MSLSAAKPCATPGGMNTPRWSKVPSALLAEVEGEGRAVGGRALAEVVEHDPGAAHRHVPVVGLVEVVVQPDDRAGLAVAAVALDHLPALREPLPAVGLDEDAALVAVDRGLDHVHAVDDIGRQDVGHQIRSIRRAPPGSGRRRAGGSPPASHPSGPPRPRRPMSESVSRGTDDDPAVLEEHGVLDLGIEDLATGGDGGERADEAVDDPRPGADRRRTAHGRVHDLGARLDDDPALDARRVVDGAVDARARASRARGGCSRAADPSCPCRSTSPAGSRGARAGRGR